MRQCDFDRSLLSLHVTGGFSEAHVRYAVLRIEREEAVFANAGNI